MATELENVSLKVVLNLEEARAAVDEIEKEQERRRGQHPSHKPPEETPVVRPSTGTSAATGEKEPPAPAPAGDALPPAPPAPQVPTSEGIDWKDVLARGKQAAGFAGAPSMDAAAHLGAELSREAGAAASAAGFASAGPAGLVLAAALAATPAAVARAPGIIGFGQGAGGAVGEGIARGALGVFGSDSFRDLYNRKAAQIEGWLATAADLGDIAFAQQRTMGAVNTKAIGPLANPIYTYRTQEAFEARQREAIESQERGRALGSVLSDFVRGNR